jgi:hypothetical protein
MTGIIMSAEACLNYGDSALNIVRCPAIVLTDRFPIGTVSARVWLTERAPMTTRAIRQVPANANQIN